jgi:Holliday junction resolvase-like predicted endonuclease
MNAKAKGARTEYKARKILEAAGYTCLKAGGSLGLFDLIALGSSDVRCVQVKCNGYCSAVEREQLALLVVAPNVSKEIWRFKDRVKAPLIERL